MELFYDCHRLFCCHTPLNHKTKNKKSKLQRSSSSSLSSTDPFDSDYTTTTSSTCCTRYFPYVNMQTALKLKNLSLSTLQTLAEFNGEYSLQPIFLLNNMCINTRELKLLDSWRRINYEIIPDAAQLYGPDSDWVFEGALKIDNFQEELCRGQSILVPQNYFTYVPLGDDGQRRPQFAKIANSMEWASLADFRWMYPIFCELLDPFNVVKQSITYQMPPNFDFIDTAHLPYTYLRRTSEREMMLFYDRTSNLLRSYSTEDTVHLARSINPNSIRLVKDMNKHRLVDTMYSIHNEIFTKNVTCGVESLVDVATAETTYTAKMNVFEHTHNIDPFTTYRFCAGIEVPHLCRTKYPVAWAQHEVYECSQILYYEDLQFIVRAHCPNYWAPELLGAFLNSFDYNSTHKGCIRYWSLDIEHYSGAVTGNENATSPNVSGDFLPIWGVDLMQIATTMYKYFLYVATLKTHCHKTLYSHDKETSIKMQMKLAHFKFEAIDNDDFFNNDMLKQVLKQHFTTEESELLRKITTHAPYPSPSTTPLSSSPPPPFSSPASPVPEELTEPSALSPPASLETSCDVPLMVTTTTAATSTIAETYTKASTIEILPSMELSAHETLEQKNKNNHRNHNCTKTTEPNHSSKRNNITLTTTTTTTTANNKNVPAIKDSLQSNFPPILAEVDEFVQVMAEFALDCLDRERYVTAYSNKETSNPVADTNPDGPRLSRLKPKYCKFKII